MQIEDVDVRHLVENVFATMLGMKVAAAMPTGDAAALPHAARITITGAWNGSVLLATSERLLRATVGAMCGVAAAEATAADLADAVLELANQLGGCVKALFPEQCQLGLPELLPAATLPAATSDDLERSFRCDGEPLRLRVVAAGPGA